MLKNSTILIVDDEPEAIKGYEQFLNPDSHKANQRKSSRSKSSSSTVTPSGGEDEFRLLTATSGVEALKLFLEETKKGNKIAAGFFDVKLGAGIDGLEVIRQIKEVDHDMLCVVVTAYQDRSVDDIGKFFGEAFRDRWDFLSKPFTQGEIIQKARQMVSSWNRKKQLEATQSQLVASERLAAVGQIARGVGHEFGNILLRILGKADLALGETDVTKIKAHLEVVVKAAERAGSIVKNLQTFSKTEPKLIQGSIHQPIEEALSLVNHELVKHSVKAEKSLKATKEISLDLGAMGQVFLNLMINALHAMPKSGKLILSTEDTHDGILTKIQDSGAGIPSDVLPRIFEFGFSTKGEQGSGVGLYITKEIIESHRGKISVKSQIGSGTTFEIWLPGK